MYKDAGGLRLALGSLGAFTKYPVSADVRQQVADRRYIGLKKYGFFQNDIATFDHVADELGLRSDAVTNAAGDVVGHWWRRHPLAFLMEAADDICYNVMDLEDAFLAGDIGFDQVIGLLEPLLTKSNKSYPDRAEAETVSLYRALAIRGAIAACVEAFKANYAAIMTGDFPISLVEASAKAREFGQIKHVAKDRIFKAGRKTELEIYGRNVVYRVLDGLIPLVQALGAGGWRADALGSYHAQVVRAVGFPVGTVDNAYDALHALTDFVSGMTDRYAVKVADMLGRR